MQDCILESNLQTIVQILQVLDLPFASLGYAKLHPNVRDPFRQKRTTDSGVSFAVDGKVESPSSQAGERLTSIPSAISGQRFAFTCESNVWRTIGFGPNKESSRPNRKQGDSKEKPIPHPPELAIPIITTEGKHRSPGSETSKFKESSSTNSKDASPTKCNGEKEESSTSLTGFVCELEYGDDASKNITPLPQGLEMEDMLNRANEICRLDGQHNTDDKSEPKKKGFFACFAFAKKSSSSSTAPPPVSEQSKTAAPSAPAAKEAITNGHNGATNGAELNHTEISGNGTKIPMKMPVRYVKPGGRRRTDASSVFLAAEAIEGMWYLLTDKESDVHCASPYELICLNTLDEQISEVLDALEENSVKKVKFAHSDIVRILFTLWVAALRMFISHCLNSCRTSGRSSAFAKDFIDTHSTETTFSTDETHSDSNAKRNATNIVFALFACLELLKTKPLVDEDDGFVGHLYGLRKTQEFVLIAFELALGDSNSPNASTHALFKHMEKPEPIAAALLLQMSSLPPFMMRYAKRRENVTQKLMALLSNPKTVEPEVNPMERTFCVLQDIIRGALNGRKWVVFTASASHSAILGIIQGIERKREDALFYNTLRLRHVLEDPAVPEPEVGWFASWFARPKREDS